MNHSNGQLASILERLDLGSSVAESDKLLETARVDTSAFADLYNDRVDLVPGTKGSGKSALFRIFVDFLPDILIKQRKVVVAHGIDSPGDPVFHAFNQEFSQLTEQQFVSFWCIYLVSLAHEQFIKGPRYEELLQTARDEVQTFRRACERAQIPEIKATKTLRDILQWALHVLAKWSPKLKYKLPANGGELELDLFGNPAKTTAPPAVGENEGLPAYVNEIKQALEAVLHKADLSLWLMIDRLDEIFPRRSTLERTALRGLLRSIPGGHPNSSTCGHPNSSTLIESRRT